MDTFVSGFIACAALIGVLKFAFMMAPLHDPDWPHRAGSNPQPPDVSKRAAPPCGPPAPPCACGGYHPNRREPRYPAAAPPSDP